MLSQQSSRSFDSCHDVTALFDLSREIVNSTMTIKDTAKTVLAKADKVISGFDDQKEKK